MNCKNCGGMVHIEGDVGVCQSCGATLSLDNIYENIDVCICYEESDANGRRTRDSLVAQEVYKKLEENKLSTFYEHISADGLIGDELEDWRIAAIHKAKIVIVLGATTDNFAALEEKYGALLRTKTVVPFCVDINPGLIPKTLSKIQAICYSTIGWDKDLVHGICNFLGREVIAEKKTSHRKLPKKKHIIWGCVSLVALAAIVLFVLLLLKKCSGADAEAATKVTTAETTKPATAQEIYELAAKLAEEGNFIEALSLLNQIPDYQDAASKITSIYEKYAGCYQNGGTSVQLRFLENETAKVDVNIQDGEKHISFSASVDVSFTTIAGNYVDNHKTSGNFSITLENTGFQFEMRTESNKKDIALTFADGDRVDHPSIEISHDTLMKWFNEKYSFEQITNLGYTLESVHAFDSYYSEELYRIQHTEIYLTIGSHYTEMAYDSNVICGICAPANLIAPSFVGKTYEPYIQGNYIYRPDQYLQIDSYNWYFTEFNSSVNADKLPETIVDDTMVGIVKKNSDESFWEEQTKAVYHTKIVNYVERNYKLTDMDYISCSEITSNDTHYLYSVRTQAMYEKSTCLWFKVNKTNHSIAFDREGEFEETYSYSYGFRVTKYLWFTEYIDYAREFPDLYNIAPESAEWDEVMEDIMYDQIYDAVRERYPEDEGSVYYGKQAENDTHILFYAQTTSMREANTCAWYKGDKADGTLTFVKEGVYVGDYFGLLDHLWFKEYPDFASEFPDAYSGTSKENLPYLQDLPYSITVNNTYYALYTEPSYDGNYVKRDDRGYTIYLDKGIYTIVEERYDTEYTLWGKLESGEGWICLSDMF